MGPMNTLKKLQSFVGTINFRVNRTTKLAPSKVTWRQFLKLAAEEWNLLLNKPRFNVGDKVASKKKTY